MEVSPQVMSGLVELRIEQFVNSWVVVLSGSPGHVVCPFVILQDDVLGRTHEHEIFRPSDCRVGG